MEAPTILCSAGELSGDQHLGKVIEAMEILTTKINFVGMGGGEFQKYGGNIIVDYRESGAVMGFWAVFLKLPKIIAAYNKMKKQIDSGKIQALLVVDFPDFNLRLAKYAKQKNVPVVYFIPPKVWAWRASRLLQLSKYVDRICSIFAFEEQFFKKNNVHQIEYVGHPSTYDFAFDRSNPQRLLNLKTHICNELLLNSSKPILLVLPGSRKNEIQRHMPIIIDALYLLKNRIPDLQVIIAKASSIDSLTPPIDAANWIRVSNLPSKDLMMICDAGIIKSGTSTLEATFARLPFICMYVAPKITEVLLKLFAEIKSISLPNIIRPNTVDELVQDQCTAERLADEVESLLINTQIRQKVVSGLEEVVKICASANDNQYKSPYERVASIVLEYANVK